MTRAISLASMLFVAALWVPVVAQDQASSGKVDPVDKAVEPGAEERTNAEGGRTVADYLQDLPTEQIEIFAAGIEKALKETHGVTVRFNGHQVSMPVVEHVAPAKIAESILSQARLTLDMRIDAGKTALLISTESNLGSTMVLPLAKVMFIEPGERKEVTNPPSDSNILAGDGLPMTRLGRGEILKQGLLDKAEMISVMLGQYNIVLPLTDKSPRRALAEALEKLPEGKHSYSFLDGRKSLYVMTQVEGLEPLLTSFIGILNAAGDPPEVSDAKPKTDAPITISVPALGPGVGLGGGGGTFRIRGFGGIEPPLPRQAIPSKNFVTGKNFVIAIAENGDRAWGYSKKLGRWTTLKFDTPFKGMPLMGEEVGCLMTAVMASDVDKSRRIWGYSPVTGGWDKLTLPVGSKAQPMVQADMILVEDGAYVQIFSAQSGKWSAPPKPDDGVVQNMGSPIGLPGPPNLNTAEDRAESDRDARTPVIKIAELKRAQATDVAATLKQIFRDAQITFVPDVRTNAVVVSAPDDQQQIINTLIDMLDQDLPAGTPGSRDPVTAMKSDTVRINASQLKEQYEAQERKAGAIAKQLQDAPAPAAAVKATLRKAVAEAFTLRQQLHQAELAAFQQRMAKIQQTIRTRDQLKEQIINRRIEDLLNPNLKWDGQATSKAPQTSTTTELEGDWSLESIKGGGVISHEQGVKVRVRGHQWITVRGDQEYSTAITVNSDVSPKTIDMATELAGGGRTRTEKGIFRLDGDTLIISWGRNGGARPTEFDGQKHSFHTMRRIDQETAATVQVRITEPEGAMITLLEQQGNGSDVAPTNHSVPIPARLNFPAGKVHRLRLSGIASHGTLEPVVTVEIPVPAEAVKGFLSLNAVPINFTNEDLNQAARGNAVIKAIYLKDRAVGELASAGPTGLEVIVNTHTDPSVDILAEADKQGTIVAVARILPSGSESQPLVDTAVRIGPYGSPKGGAEVKNGVAPFGADAAGTPTSTNQPDGRLILKSVEDFQQRLITVESAVNTHREALRQAKAALAAGTGKQASVDACQIQVDAWGKKLAVIAAELEAQIKLLELEGKFAKRASEIAEAEYLKALQANKVLPGTHTDLEIRRLKLRWESAALKMEQATVLLGLYQKVAPESKPATPATDPMGATSAITPNEERIWKTLGLRLTQAAPSAIHKANSVYNGGLDVLEVRPDSPAAVDGRIQQGDILCGLHVWRIESIDHVMFVLNHHEFSVFQPLKFFVLRDGKTLSGHMKVGASAPPPSELVSPPSTEEISKKNLSDLMLALHHYHDQHKHFPPAVIMGKDGKGKVPHSWRVEILPHLGEQKLYDEYHFDEAWNSEHNQKLLDRIPAVFRSPLDRPDSYSTSYFALVTPGLKPQSSSGAAAGTGDASEVLRYDLGTVFSNPRGAQLLDIHDGTARTVALVESKRSVAWMQPEDISYSADQPVPLLGGWYVDGWNAAFADGTVKMISNQNTDAILRAIFTIGDGINALPKVVDDSAEEAGTVPPASKN